MDLRTLDLRRGLQMLPLRLWSPERLNGRLAPSLVQPIQLESCQHENFQPRSLFS